jgi:hypothetical protein
MNRQEIVDSAYQAELELNRLKAKHGIISKEMAQETEQMAQETEQRLYTGIEMLNQIDDMIASGREEQLTQLKDRVDWVNMSWIGGKRELELPTSAIKLRLPNTVWSLIRGR